MEKKIRNLMSAVVPALVLALIGCQGQINYLKARNELNNGVRAFASANYVGAVASFDQAIEHDPELLDARSYRAYCYMMQIIPGGESDENMRVAEQALEGFQDVLDRDPNNQLALSSIASVYFNIKDFEKSREAYRKVIAEYPESKEAYYTVGVINWTESYQPRLEIRASLGMAPEDPGPIKDQKARAELAETTGPLIEEGLDVLTKAVEIDPDYSDAMAYVNLLYRERADLSETTEAYEQDIAAANDWAMKSLEASKRKAQDGLEEAF